jgi:hypothetical protein
MGYAVVDPMPRPAHCRTAIVGMPSSASFDDAGVLTIKLGRPPGRADFKFIASEPGDPLSLTASNESTTITADSATVRIKVGASDTTVTTTVRAFCNEGPTSISVTASWTGKPSSAAKPTLRKQSF